MCLFFGPIRSQLLKTTEEKEEICFVPHLLPPQWLLALQIVKARV